MDHIENFITVKNEKTPFLDVKTIRADHKFKLKLKQNRLSFCPLLYLNQSYEMYNDAFKMY